MEITVPDLAGSLGGGGRYDGLIGMFLGDDIPACGFSLGLERILVVMGERGMFPPGVQRAAADVMVTLFEGEPVEEGLALARELRPDVVTLDVKMPRLGGLEPLQRLVRFHPGIERPRLVAAKAAQMRQPNGKLQGVRQPVETVGDLVGRIAIHIADEPEGDVVVLGIDPARAAEPASLEREGKTHIGGNFETGKEPGHGVPPWHLLPHHLGGKPGSTFPRDAQVRTIRVPDPNTNALSDQTRCRRGPDCPCQSGDGSPYSSPSGNANCPRR